MKVIEKNKRIPFTKNVTIRLEEDTLKMILSIAMEYKVSRQLIINRILKKSLASRDFSIEL